jgi:hypothetical protein
MTYLMETTLPTIIGMGVVSRTTDTLFGRGSRGGTGRTGSRKTKTVTKVKLVAVAVARTKAEAETKATKYIKPGHRGIKKQSGVYKGKKYNYVVYVK